MRRWEARIGGKADDGGPAQAGLPQSDTLAAVRPKVFTIPADRPFLDCLANAILKGDLPCPGGPAPDPLSLPDITLLMPTRRASRALAEAFLRASACRGTGAGRALLLPRIQPIAEGEEEEAGFFDAYLGWGLASGAGDAIPPAIGALERRLALTHLVLAWSHATRAAAPRIDAGLADVAHGPDVGANTPAKAAALAGELGRLIDLVETEEASLADIKDLVSPEFAAHWLQTTEFLSIITAIWPAHLAERGLIGACERRNRLIEATALRLARPRPGPPAPVIVAGVTGSVPATVRLMRAVAGLPLGAIVLPGLDLSLDDASYEAISPRPHRRTAGSPPEQCRHGHPEHPQHGLKRLLDRLDLTRAEVMVLPGAEPSQGAGVRARFIAEALRPAATTGLWQAFVRDADPGAIALALQGVSLIEAESADIEAETVALILREALETPGRTASLVTPDRRLARRVAARLASFGIEVDDSAGRPFPKTVPGVLLDLVIGVSERDFAALDVVALLKHPMCRLGLAPGVIRRLARNLELAAFRTAYLGRGLSGIRAALAQAHGDPDIRRHPAVARMRSEDFAALDDLVDRLELAYAPLTGLAGSHDPQALACLVGAHVTTTERVAAPAPDAEPAPHPVPGPGAAGASPASPLWEGAAGRTAEALFAALTDANLPAPLVRAGEYADLYRSLVACQTVREQSSLHPRLAIWGPLESRLQRADVVVLGGLNERVWPKSADPGPWLNRPMRAKLGLPAPEEDIGRAAHDFSSLLAGERVILTRAMKVDGAPTVPSRWLLRLKTLLGGIERPDALDSGEPHLAWARARDRVSSRPRARPPEPRPALGLRPRRLSVSAVETLIANPYAVYAEHILRLKALQPLGATPDAALRGSIVHAVLARFAKTHPDVLPDDPAGVLLALARAMLTEHSGSPRVAAFWLPRLERFAHWFAATEPGRRIGVTRTLAEIDGRLILDAPGGPFTLTARADRLDVLKDGRIAITDYKTGRVPKTDAVLAGERPQMPLEAMIAEAGGFAGLGSARVAKLAFISASGAEPPGAEHVVRCDDIGALAARTGQDLARLIALFDDAATPYASLRRARFDYAFDAYAHLARVGDQPDSEEGGE